MKNLFLVGSLFVLASCGYNDFDNNTIVKKLAGKWAIAGFYTAESPDGQLNKINTRLPNYYSMTVSPEGRVAVTSAENQLDVTLGEGQFDAVFMNTITFNNSVSHALNVLSDGSTNNPVKNYKIILLESDYLNILYSYKDQDGTVLYKGFEMIKYTGSQLY